MSKKTLYGIILIVAIGLSLIYFLSPKQESGLELSYKTNNLLAITGDGQNETTDKNSTVTEKPSESAEIQYIEFGESEGELLPRHIMLSPLEDYSDGVGITFNLDVFSENVKVLVLDDKNSVISEYETNVGSMEVIDSSGSYIAYVYKASLNGLNANGSYSYTILLENTYSKLYSFETMAEESTTMAFFGDTQGYLDSQYEDFKKTYNIAKNVSEESGKSIDLNYIAGDIVDDGGNYDQWKFFYNHSEHIFSEEQLITTIGNHDVYNGPDYYVNSFNYPSNGVSGLEERSFFIDLPYARVAVFDTESTSTYIEQAEWLTEIMSEASQPFNIVLMHRSAYPMAYDEAYIRQLSIVFEIADIDLVLSGHDHIYSRTTMKADEKVDLNEGVTYIIGGSSTGSKFYGTLDEESRYWKNIVYDDNYPVFTLIDIGEDKIEVKAYSIIEDEVSVIDSFELSE